jgi:hypothetical protein
MITSLSEGPSDSIFREVVSQAGKTYLMQGREIWSGKLPHIRLVQFLTAWPTSSTPKMAAADYFETSATLHQTARRQISEDCSLDGVHLCWDVRSILTELTRVILVRYELIYRCNSEIELVS